MENIVKATIDDFKKLDLRVAKVLEAERVEGSEKLVRLQLEVGESRRQILAGIGKVYSPEELVGKHIIIVANLESRQMMGFESEGMLLAAGRQDGAVVLLVPEKEIASGSKIN